jgi:hypothetical protein
MVVSIAPLLPAPFASDAIDDEMRPGSGRGEPPARVGPERPFCLQRPDALTGADLVRIKFGCKEPAAVKCR